MDDLREHDRRQRVLGHELIVRKAPPYFLSMRFPADRDKLRHLGILIAEKLKYEPKKKTVRQAVLKNGGGPRPPAARLFIPGTAEAPGVPWLAVYTKA